MFTVPLIRRLLQPRYSKWFMAVYLAFILCTAAIGTGQPSMLVRGLVIVAIYVAVDLLWTWTRDRVTYLPLSAVISGLIGAIVLDPLAPWWIVGALPITAAAGKHLLRLRKRHAFNPIALSLVLLALAYPSAISWWAVAWWGPVFKLIALGSGAFMLWRIRRWTVAIPFTIVYAVGLAIVLFRQEVVLALLPALLWDGTLIFFVSVMLVEPVTTSYRTRQIRQWYGVGVGFLVLLIPLLPIRMPDGFLPALLIGNLLATLVSIRKPRASIPIHATVPPSP